MRAPARTSKGQTCMAGRSRTRHSIYNATADARHQRSRNSTTTAVTRSFSASANTTRDLVLDHQRQRHQFNAKRVSCHTSLLSARSWSWDFLEPINRLLLCTPGTRSRNSSSRLAASDELELVKPVKFRLGLDMLLLKTERNRIAYYCLITIGILCCYFPPKRALRCDPEPTMTSGLACYHLCAQAAVVDRLLHRQRKPYN